VNTARYPSGWERTARARDGTEFYIRPIRPDDAERERQFIETLSPESRYKRFMHTVHDPSSSFIQQMVNVDYQRTMAFVAAVAESDSAQIIGVAQYAATDEQGSNCEFAVAVADAWQSRGVGTTLMRLLLKYARLQGFTQTHGPILAANTHMVELAHDLGLKMRHVPGDWAVVEALGAFRP
jgi:acetyltransferase